MFRELPETDLSKRQSCVLIGNGINRIDADKVTGKTGKALSWQNIIEDMLTENGDEYSYQALKDMPANMQVVLATKDRIDANMKKLSAELLQVRISDKAMAIYDRLLGLPCSDILSANYSFELEYASGMPRNKGAYRNALCKTKELSSKEAKFRVFNYYPYDAGNKRLWHVHGDISKPETMIMGHYYYGNQLSFLQSCVSTIVGSVKSSQTKGLSYHTRTWLELFLLEDVHILGFSMYLCEMDIWWLLCCKKRHYPDTHVYFYTPQKDIRCGEEKYIAWLLQAYGAEVIEIPVKNNDYYRFYTEALDRIESTMRIIN